MPVTETFSSAAEAGARLGADARFLAGGTLLMRDVNFADTSFARIVRTTDPALAGIRSQGGRTEIGSAVTMAQIIDSPEAGFLAPVARKIGGPAVRNMATVGGNLFARHPFGDFAVALLALDAVVRLSDGSELRISELLDRRDTLRSLVVSVSVQRPMGDDFRFLKVSRTKPKGASVLSIAAWLPRMAGRVSGARVAYGAMGPAPVRVGAVERALEGARLDQAGITPAVQVATQGLTPPDDALASSWYRTEVAPVHLGRLLMSGGVY